MTADEPIPLRSDEDVVRARHRVRELAQRAGLRLVDQTKLVTAVSELARNTVIHGGGGQHARPGWSSDGARMGVYADLRGRGAGHPGPRSSRSPTASARAPASGSASAGAKRLVDEFEVRARDEGGTFVRVVTWR